MKKKRYLKGWVAYLLGAVLLLSFMIMGAETEQYFVSSKIVALITAVISGYILINYTKMEG